VKAQLAALLAALPFINAFDFSYPLFPPRSRRSTGAPCYLLVFIFYL